MSQIIPQTQQVAWYDEVKHTLVCPINYRELEECKKVTALEQLGVTFLQILPMPVDLGFKFFLVKLPDWLKYEPPNDGDDRILEFVDEKSRPRLRVIKSHIMLGTNIWTRYTPDFYHQIFYSHPSIILPCVKDLERIDPNSDDEKDEGIIWKGEPSKEKLSLEEVEDQACKWLDKTYPDWRNPLAYWT